jgi:hypothetical protein
MKKSVPREQRADHIMGIRGMGAFVEEQLYLSKEPA